MSVDTPSHTYRTVLFTTMLNRMPPARRRDYMAFHGFGFLAKPVKPVHAGSRRDKAGDPPRELDLREAS